MFKKRKPIKQDEHALLAREYAEKLSITQQEVIYKLQTLKQYKADPSTCAPLDFSSGPTIEYSDGVFIKDLTTDEQSILGLSLFHVHIDETTYSPVHNHTDRYQIIYVKKGKIVNESKDKEYIPGDIFFIRKNEPHSIKYTENSELIFIHVPGLHLIGQH